ncbi:MAG: IPT/TIG domain-containing protein [Candidatus Kapabacteria bacterium]|nr:IPT/TIG domain-containing protein [Candidatus Kapabacteria bacterium]
MNARVLLSRSIALCSLMALLLVAALNPSAAQVVTTFAGSTAGYTDATGVAARFNQPYGIAASGGVLYVTDRGNHRIRQISAGAAVTTLAGSGTPAFTDAMGTSAQFSGAHSVAMSGTNLVIADAGNNRIRQVSAAGNATTIAGNGTGALTNGMGTSAEFNFPVGVAVDGGGNIYVADYINHCIRYITSGGVVTTFAGNGTSGYVDATGTAARFNLPAGVAIDGGGNVFVADQLNHRIRRITPGGVVTTFAGSGVAGWADGTGTAAQFNEPTGLAFDGAGNLIVADRLNHRIRQITPGGVVTTIAGNGTAGFMDATGTAARFSGPTGVAVSGTTIYVADLGNNRIRAITPPPVPTITNISPTIAGAGMTVIITGTNLTGAAAVSFGGVPAASFTVISATQVNAVVAAGSASGNVSVTTPGGTAVLAGFTFIPPPTITGFTPTSASTGTVVSITGTNFIGVTSASFGAVNAAGYMTVSATQVNATVAAGGATGNVQIVTSGGTVSLTGFTFIPPPTITSFAPMSAASGATVTINGTNFTGATSVRFGGVDAASFMVVSATQITAVVAAGGATGSVQVTAPGGTATSAGFTFIAPPTITSFTPNVGGMGTSVTITGTNLSGATGVLVGGVAATITGNTATSLTFTVAAGATGTIQVTTPGGMVTSVGTFTWFPAPTITSFMPAAGAPGAVITIDGTNFTDTPNLSVVRFGGVLAASVTFVSANQITAVVAAGGATGNVQVVTPGGTVNSAGFTFLPLPPTVTSFTPTTRCPGGAVTITGTNFVAPATVTIGGVAATGVVVVNPTTITCNVGAGGATGTVDVTTPGGTAPSAAMLTVVPTPTITGFVPTTQTAGGTVTITGTGFTGVTGPASVRFGGVNAASYVVVSATQIDAVVAAGGASGNVFVQSPGGCTVNSPGFTFSAPAPTITGFAPTSGIAGTVITITGTGFTGTVAANVRFGATFAGGTPAASIAVVSDTQINATLGAGASGSVWVQAPGGTTSMVGFAFAAITSFTPAVAANGTVVTINGAGFTGATAVRFGTNMFGTATPAAMFNIVNDNQITATVAAGASGRVWVQAAAGTLSTAAGSFTFVNPPTITGITPTLQGNGGVVTITGTNFIAAPAPTVTFGGVPAASFMVVSATQINATVAAGATGMVSVTTIAGTANFAGFTFAPTPTITSFAPMSAPVGGTITINGTGFFAAPLPTVNIGGVAATGVTFVSGTQITANVAAGSASGMVQVTTPGGTANSPGFQLAPTVTSFAPTSAGAGTTVTINGSGFTGATGVSFGGVAAASFMVVSATQITAVVAPGSLSGNVQVTTPVASASLAGFTFIPPPTITMFTPTSAMGGATVTITGTNFTGATAVSFGGIAAASYMVVSATQIDAVVSAGGSTGTVQVTTPGGTVTSGAGFTFIPQPPTITMFTPTSAGGGATVTITGTHFAGVSIVSFGGVNAASFTVISPTQINAVVAAGGASGSVRVTALGGTIMTPGFTFIPPPTITSFSPMNAGTGTVVTINGTGFTGATAVSFGGAAAAGFTVVSATQITATVGAGASGNIQVTTPGGTGTQAGFTYLPGPGIIGFAPMSAAQGTTVVITGTNFTGVSAVSFGGTPAMSYMVISPTQINAVVGAGASGDVSVTTSGGTVLSPGFTFIAPPNITFFTPSGANGATIVINGSGFTGATAVTFGGTNAASFTVLTDNLMTAVVGAGSSGNVVVTGPGGVGTRPGFTFNAGPMITGFTPTSAGPGMTVVINGAGFLGATGATAVQFGGVNAASYTVVSATQIVAIVGAGGASGVVRVQTPGGVNTLAGFTFVPAPTITGFAPVTAAPSTTVTITGTNFTGATSVTIGGFAPASFTVVSATQINAVIGTGATGSITVFTPGGSASQAGFMFVPPPPAITGFTPTASASGGTVTITGVNFLSPSAITFGGTPVTSFSLISPTQINAVIGAGASGNVSVTTPGGVAVRSGFTYYPQPTITSFAPTSAPTGTVVTINGTNFTGASIVRFGATTAANFTVVSATQITAQVGTGMSGNVSVVTSGGTATLAGFTYLPSPTIASILPNAGGPGSTITINGANFTGATAVRFGGVLASSFVIVSPTQITAVVAAGGSTGTVTVTSPSGTGGLGGFTFFLPPNVTSFTPPSRGPGGVVVITGTNFVNISSVRFGTTPAASFTTNSPTQISAVVGLGASGSVSVQNPGGTGSLAGFTFVPVPTLTSISPTSGEPGDEIIINGTNFIGVSSVSFGSVSAASFMVLSPTQIRAIVPGAAGTSIVVQTTGGTATIGGFRFIPAPTITGILPASGRPGDVISIVGTNLATVRRVTFGGAAATGFTAVSPTLITAIVGDFGASGHTLVETPDGIDSLAGFTFIFPTPRITDFSPRIAGPNMTITITGTGLWGASTATFGGVAATGLRVASPTQMTAIISSGASGSLVITTPGGSASLAGFTFVPAPVITGIMPSSASPGDTITITGTNLNGVTAVSFGNIPAQNFIIVSPTQIRAVVPRNGGAVGVTSPGGTFISSAFTTAPPPSLFRFTPTAQAAGGVVNIIGRNFVGVRSVSFGGTNAASFVALSDTLIRAVVGAGASGLVSVTTTAGNVTLAGFRFILPPMITGFSPSVAGPGTTITITGTNLLDITSASIGGVAAENIRVVSPSEVTILIPTNATLTTNTISVLSPAGIVTTGGFTLIPAPVLSSFSPVSGGPGTVVTLRGVNLRTVSAVRFGGVTVASFSVQSDSVLVAVLANGSTGSVSVVSSGGTASLSGFSYIPPSPIITGFSPSDAGAGTTVTITGTNFIGVREVRFGDVPALSFVVISPTEIRAVVATTANGSVSVVSETGTGSRAGFAFIPEPTLSVFTPTSAGAGSTVTLLGTNLSNASAVSFGGVSAATFVVISPTEIRAVIGTGASGSIVVTTPGGTTSTSGFALIPPPRITSFSPTSGHVGTLVTINGTNLTGARYVGFGGTTTSAITVISPTQMTATVPVNALTGTLSVSTPGGTATSAGIFTFIPAPTITDFSPKALGVGGVITIIGTNFTTAATVRIGTTVAPNVTYISARELRVVVPLGTAGGSITVTTVGGSVTQSGFTLLISPRITSFTPTSASTGTVVTITGTSLMATTTVTFGGVSAATFSVISDTQVQATVGAGASGHVGVTTPAGRDTLRGFVYLGAPIITNFTPARAGTGRVVTIIGDGFTGTTRVTFGGVVARHTVVSPTQMTAVIGSGATGDLTVVNAGGQTSVGGFTFVDAPVVTSFSPTSGAIGTTIVIRGTNLGGATNLSIGGVNIPFTANSSEQITAQVPLGGIASGAIAVSTLGGVGQSDSTFTFIPPPVISSAKFVQSRQGLIMNIFGENFVGTTTVTIGRTDVPFTIVNQNQVNAALQAGVSQSDVVALFTPGGMALSEGQLPIPSIAEVSPSRGSVGARIVIAGQRLDATSRASIGGVEVPFRIVSPTQLELTIPPSGASGVIGLATPQGTVTTTTTFTLITNEPVIVSFTPTQGDIGTLVRVFGENFNEVRQVSIGGLTVPYRVLSPQELTITIPIGATSGNIVLLSPIGVTISTGRFTFAPNNTDTMTTQQQPIEAGVLRSYPNPATDLITIAYALDKPQTVRLYLMDARGIPLQTQEPGRQNKGEYTATFPVSNLPVGTYIVVMETSQRRLQAFVAVVR